MLKIWSRVNLPKDFLESLKKFIRNFLQKLAKMTKKKLHFQLFLVSDLNSKVFLKHCLTLTKVWNGYIIEWNIRFEYWLILDRFKFSVFNFYRKNLSLVKFLRLLFLKLKVKMGKKSIFSRIHQESRLILFPLCPINFLYVWSSKNDHSNVVSFLKIILCFKWNLQPSKNF